MKIKKICKLLMIKFKTKVKTKNKFILTLINCCLHKKDNQEH